MASNPEKDTIYIDVDEDITGIIDKVRGSDEKIVALVLPKRATVLQSIVNMKLLKRTSDELKKKVVLITSEGGLLPLAGAVGLYVAKTLQSAPHIPDPPATPTDMTETVDSEADDTPLDKSEPVGKLAGLPDEEDTIEVDNDADDDGGTAAAGSVAGKAAKKMKKKLKVPNFDSFRTRLLLIVGGLLVLLLLWVLTSKILPKAKLTITTDSSSLNTSLDFTADAGVKAVDEKQNILPATQKTFTKTDNEKVAATGQKDKGTKATGTVTLKNCTHNTAGNVDIPAGTVLTNSSLNFVTQSAISLPPSIFNGPGACTSYTYSVGVQAQGAGDQYNISGGRTFTVNGYPDVSGVDSTAMAGGTSNLVKIVAQADVDGAKQKILDRNNDPAKAELQKQMQADKLFALNDSFAVGTPAITTTPNVGDEASDVTVNMTVSYTMLGVKNDDLKKIVENEIKKHIDTNKQTILNNGIDKAQTSITNKASDTNVKVTLQTTAEAGAKLDAVAIKKAVAGKKRGDTQATIEARPGIKDVKIDYSPFWVGGTPSRTSRITVIFLQPNGQPSKQ